MLLSLPSCYVSLPCNCQPTFIEPVLSGMLYVRPLISCPSSTSRALCFCLTCCVMCAGSASPSLAAELDLLLHLLAVAPNLACSQSTQQQPPLFPTGAAGSLYAGQVLTLSGQSQLTSHHSIGQLYAKSNYIHNIIVCKRQTWQCVLCCCIMLCTVKYLCHMLAICHELHFGRVQC